MFNWSKVWEREAMMYRVVRISAFVAVLVHMLFGCCLHHGHGSVPHGKAATLESPCHAHQHRHDPESDPPCDNRSGPGGCDGDRCAFTLRKTTDSDGLCLGRDCLTLVWLVPILSAPGGLDSSDSGGLRRAGPPPRLHLLNQALLL
jgi:hypothetical protein